MFFESCQLCLSPRFVRLQTASQSEPGNEEAINVIMIVKVTSSLRLTCFRVGVVVASVSAGMRASFLGEERELLESTSSSSSS